ncbi:hypothetical protein DRH14_01490 [Candidatus Shapirobacteria bacterium]|nr:MAG: hypothetical protein DRH14_01490 [Candidatus Shapirobacteria bacterium]
MPNLDGRGPVGQGRGLGRGQGRRGQGGSVDCVCPKCGHVSSHVRGTPCTQAICPKCGNKMQGVFCR